MIRPSTFALSPFSTISFNSLLTIFFFTFLLCADTSAQSCQSASVELAAVTQSSPPRITLQWRADAGASQHYVYRKLKNASSWGAVIGNVDGLTTTFIDSAVSVGVSYEYRVLRQAPTYSGYGYINSGIEIPAVHSRGIIILVVDESFLDSLAFEIARLRSDLEGDGWKVVQHNVSRTASVTDVKSLIVGTYNLDKPNTKAVFLLGRIPVPYSGDIFPDGHPDHEGAWPADVYYADMNGMWTDNAVNVTVATDPRHHNVPGDGRFDQSLVSTDVELQIGRVDFANMPSFASSEQQLLKNYLDKDHNYRHKNFKAAYRGVVDDNFGYFGGEAFASSGWKNISTLVGAENVIADDYFTVQRDSTYLWSYGCGGGWYQGAGGVGSTGDFANSNLKGIFSMLFGSYFGDWDSNDNFLRAALAQGTTLTNAWSGRPHWVLHHMGLGENIGYSTRITQNNNSIYYFSYGARFVHIALMGDPTLRNDVIAPVTGLDVLHDGANHLLTWFPSADPVLGYHVYVKTELDSNFVLLNDTPVADLAFSHDCVGEEGLHTYMVRAVGLQNSVSGTYYNLSQGITDTISGITLPLVSAEASWEIIGSTVVFTNLSLNASSYSWDFGDGQNSTEANPVHTYTDGFFNVTLISSNGCTADTFYFDLNVFTGVRDIREDPSLLISPNPGSGIFVVSWDSKDDKLADINLYSSTGQLVYTHEGFVSNSTIDLTSVPDGLYVMHIRKGDVVSYKRLAIQR